MENYVTAQLAALCKAVLLGWLSGCVYDLLRSVRLLRRRSRALTHTLDALYGAALLLALLGFALHVAAGSCGFTCCWARRRGARSISGRSGEFSGRSGASGRARPRRWPRCWQGLPVLR